MKLLSQNKRSFTLIEMLIVVVIIGVLASLLLPTLGKVRERGRCTKCKSNLKNLQIAAMNYAYDYFQRGDAKYMATDGKPRGVLPASSSGESRPYMPADTRYYQTTWGWVDWTAYRGGRYTSPQYAWTYWWGNNARTSITNGWLWSYTSESMKVYLCPTWKILVSSPKWPNQLTTQDPVRSYVMNSQVSGASVLTMTNASRKLLFSEPHTSQYDPTTANRRYPEGNGRRSWIGMRYHDGSYKWAMDGEIRGYAVTWAWYYPNESLGDYHDGRVNGVFVDGHVESLLWSDTIRACAGNW